MVESSHITPSSPKQFIQALCAAKELSESNIQELHPVVYEDALIFYIPQTVKHPLSSLVGRTRDVALITKRITDQRNEDQPSILLQHTQRITVGLTSNDKRRYLNGVDYSSYGHTDEQDIPTTCDVWQPLDADDARYLLSLYALGSPNNFSKADESPILFAYCVRENGDRAFMGIQLSANSANQTPTYSVFEVKDCGFVASETEENCEPIPSLDELLDVFTDLAEEDGELYVGHICARYDVLAETSVSKSEGQVTSSFIQLKTIWRGIQKPLSAPPSSANVILQIKTVDGHLDSETHAATRSILHELDTLAQWLGIAQAGARWTGDLDKTGSEATMRAKKWAMGGMVDNFLEDVKNEGSAMGVDEEGSVTVDVFSALSTRKDLDFTERFWKFCQDAQSQDELVDALTAVIEELETGRLQPMIHKENHSNLGNLIRDCLKLARLQTTVDYDEQRETIGRAFDYWLGNPLECLCEVGMFKLRRDYCFYLVGNDLVSWNQLGPFLDETLPLPEQLTRLRRLHRVLELWSLVRANVLAIPYETLRALVQAAVAHYAKDDFSGETQDELRYAVHLPRYSSGTEKMMGGLVRSFDPSFWELTIYKDNPNTVTSVPNSAYKEPPSPYVLIAQFDRSDAIFGREKQSWGYELGSSPDSGMTEILNMSILHPTPFLLGLRHRYRMLLATGH